MARDNSPKERQKQDLERKKKRARAPFERILIVSEGSKTEPLYFAEIRSALRLPVHNITASPGALGTEPIQVVEYAKELFENGDAHKGIEPRAFDQIYAVFDRDDHLTYHDALRFADSLNGKLRNDEKKSVPFKAIASVPSFELWLLLHYMDIHAPMRRDEVMERLKSPGNYPDYEKGAGRAYAETRSRLTLAMQRADRLSVRFCAQDAPEPYTGVHELVRLLLTLRD